jgi:hypothetical protein
MGPGSGWTNCRQTELHLHQSRLLALEEEGRMDDHGTSRESFRRSWLTTTPEWAVAGGVSLAVGLAVQYFGLQGGWAGPTLIWLPLIWAGGRTLQWACHTWTVTPDRRLTVRQGILFPTRQVIRLCSVSQIAVDAPAPICWLDVGHISFEAADPQGQRRRFHWTWLHGYERLAEIIRAQGRLPIGEPTWWQTVREAAKQRMQAALRRVVRTLSRADLQDYGRFLAFCHHVLRAEQTGRWPPGAIRPTMVERWMAVLRQARMVVSASNERGWRVAGGIESLDDIRRRLGPHELRRAVQRSARLRWHWTT